MKISSLTTGLALIVTGTVIGVGAQQIASADVSSGDRPVLVPIESCRLADTRPDYNVGPRTSPLGPTETYRLDSQQTGTECTGNIPASASALAINLTAPNATADGFVTVWAEGDRPNGSTLNPQPGQLVFNGATADLAADNSFLVYNERGNTDIIVDVIGYYENHDHDDRYDTSTEVDAKIVASVAALDARAWSIPIAPTEMVNPSITEFWPAITFNTGTASGASGLAFRDADFGRAWFSFEVPDSYRDGSDLRIDVEWMPIPTGFGIPTVGCDVNMWANSPSVNRPGTDSFGVATTWEIPYGFTSDETLLRFTADGMNGVLQTTYMDLDGEQIVDGDRITVALNRDGDDAGDTCTGGVMVTGMTVGESP